MGNFGFGRSGKLRLSGRPWPDGPTPVAHVADIARMASKVAGRTIKETTVRDWLYQSQPPGSEKRPRRYSANPFPAPDRYIGTIAEWIWRSTLEDEVQRWVLSRPGHGVRTHRDDTVHVATPRPRQPRQPSPKKAGTNP